MISCTEFIPAYNELFRFIESRGGKQGVVDFWHDYASRRLTYLRDLAQEKGLRGCWEYWSHTLNEEAADFEMTLDERAGEFTILMHACPSKGRLLKSDDVEPYRDYCEHCDVLYRHVLEPLGFDYDIDLSRCDRARCVLTVRRP